MRRLFWLLARRSISAALSSVIVFYLLHKMEEVAFTIFYKIYNEQHPVPSNSVRMAMPSEVEHYKK